MKGVNRAGQLFAAIVEAPDDDEPRRVYADLLHEQGDPLGEFIHVQLALARDPTNRGARIIENKLLEAHGSVWRSDVETTMPELTLSQLAYEFRRGFIESATMPLSTLHHVDALVRAAPLLRSLRIVPGIYNDPTSLPRASLADFASPALARLRALDVQLPGIGNRLADALARAQLANLETLTIHASVWGDVALWYKRPPGELVLDGVGTAILASRLPAITKLVIDQNRIGAAGLAAIAQGRWRLTELDAGENAIDGLGDALAGPATAGLTTLRIAHTHLESADAAWIVSKLPALRDLDVERCDLGVPGTQALCDALAVPLHRLRIERNSLGDAGSKALAACAKLATLRELEMGHNRMGHKGAVALATSPHLAQLERLTLNEPRWKPETKAAIAASETLANTRVYIGGKLVSKLARRQAKEASRTSRPGGSRRA